MHNLLVAECETLSNSMGMRVQQFFMHSLPSSSKHQNAVEGLRIVIQNCVSHWLRAFKELLLHISGELERLASLL